jgi:5'-nucleotidase
MERRIFLQNSIIVGTGLAISPSLLSFPKNPDQLEKITILHTNDTHSNIETFPSTHAKYPNQGGVARRYSLLKEIRRKEKNVLLLDAGDIFQGTPYFNKFHGELEMKLMTHMGYDSATMGNHDFDAGIDGFLNAYQYGEFPFVCSNYNFNNTALKGVTKEYQIFNKGPFKVGVFGLGVGLEGLVAKANYQDTEFLKPIPIANRIAKHLRFEEQCDLVICLSHLGYEPKQFKDNDQLLASETENIDLIIGGHTHTFLPKPEVHLNRLGEKVLINQVGWAGLALGRIDFYLDEKKRNKRHDLVMV